jgi:hypothetical protein
MGLVVEDVDSDGDMDVLRTNFDLEVNSLHVNDGHGNFTERGGLVGLAQPSLDKLGWGASFLDADCDGDLDLLVANGHVYPQAQEIGMSGWLMPTQLYEATGASGAAAAAGALPQWRDVTANAGSGLAPLKSARGLAVADVDDDGDTDALVIDMDGPPRLLENRSARQGHWISVRPLGTVSNRDGIGARESRDGQLARPTAPGRARCARRRGCTAARPAAALRARAGRGHRQRRGRVAQRPASRSSIIRRLDKPLSGARAVRSDSDLWQQAAPGDFGGSARAIARPSTASARSRTGAHAVESPSMKVTLVFPSRRRATSRSPTSRCPRSAPG